MGKSNYGTQQEQLRQNQNVRADPVVERLMHDILQQGGQLARNVPETPEFFQGDVVAGLNADQRRALDALYARGAEGSAEEQGLSDYVSSQLGQDYTGSLLSGSEGLAEQLGASGSALSNLASGGMGLDAASQFAQGEASPYTAGLESAASGQINPLTSLAFQQGFGDLTEQFNESVLPGINSAFGAAGRTGSGLHSQAVTNAAGELADAGAGLAANIFGGASESALERQLAASQAGVSDDLARRGLAANLFSSGQDRGLSAAGLLQEGGLAGLAGLGNLAGLQQGVAGLVPALSGIDYANLDAMLGSGDMRQLQRQAEIDADIARYEHNASRDIQDYERQLASLGAVTGLTSGLAGTGSTTMDAKTRGRSKGAEY